MPPNQLGAWGWHDEHGLVYVTSLGRNREHGDYYHIRTIDGNEGIQVPYKSVRILASRTDMIALADSIHQASQ